MEEINQISKISITNNGTIIFNNLEYKLEIKTPLGWSAVSIKKIRPLSNGWEITASKLGMSKTEIVPKQTMDIISKNLGKDIIDFGGTQPKRLVKINDMKINETQLSKVIRKALNEHYENYMFFSNLQQIKRQCDMMLEMDQEMIDKIIQGGHDWADDHISEAKTNIDQVFDFFMNEMRKRESYAEYEDITEGRKKTGTKLCARGKSAAKAKFKVYPSAYANGYAVQVCKGKMPGLDGKKKCSSPYC